MRSDKFFCKDCNRYFYKPLIYLEKHGLDSPPYQQVPICPYCENDNFCEFNSFVEKIDIAEKLLPIVMLLNNYSNSLKNVFGGNIENEDIASSVEIICETITEMFDFLEVDVQRKILNIDSDKKLNEILRYLDGEG